MSADKSKMPLKVIMTINGARGLLWELVANYHFSEDDTVRIMRCLKDLKNLNLMFQTEQDVSNNVAKPDLQHLQAENNRLREALKSQIKALLALKGFHPETSLFADNNIRRIKQALNGESEE